MSENTARRKKEAIPQRYWLSYDLGIRGEYPALYEWLDELKAVECGDSVASFLSTKSLEEIKKELRDCVGKGARVYLVRLRPKPSGGFILGGRKPAPWLGASSQESAEDSDDA